jgi:beta-galactosidase/beta-glucuronidase
MAVTSESLSDTLASASQYAVHPLGGIPRKVTLFAIPKVNVKSYHVTTEFDAAFDDATMAVSMKISNQAGEELQGAKLKFSLLKWPTRKSVKLKSEQFELSEIGAGKTLDETIEIAVDSPDKWDNEHPNLYVLQCKLLKDSKTIQTVERRFGFRQVEVRGNELFVNNQPVKLRASNRHEAHPLRGRSLIMEQWRADVELFREANCNLIRTSHYPPAEEFIEICDELGLFVEEEAPLCWVGHGANGIWKEWNPHSRDYLEIIVRGALEMIERDRSHPSIVFWSLANESQWGPNFERSYESAREYDPSRPFTFHDQASGGFNNYGSLTEIANHHYPGPNGPRNFSEFKRPMWFGEYCHLDAYNRYELWTDPGLRDAWGRGFKSMWDNMYTTQAILGGALWSGIDDTFHLPSGHTVGYGTWGPIDGWRRRKPEHWHAKKVYSPVRISASHIEAPATGTTITIPLENRHNFTNISELDISWQIGKKKGKATADIAPRTKGQMAIRTKVSDLKGKHVYLCQIQRQTDHDHSRRSCRKIRQADRHDHRGKQRR